MKLRQTIVAGMSALAMGTAGAAAVVSGTINEVLNPRTATRIGSTVDHWKFTVNSAGLVTIDTLSWEADSENRVTANGVFEAVDVNGDGRIAFLDTYIYLFKDDGNLDLTDLIAENDDNFNNTYADGSIYGYDSFLSLNLNPGNYILAIGAYSLTSAEAVAKSNDETFYPATCTNPGVDCNFAATAQGDYRLTFTGDLVVRDPNGVPEPGTMALLLAPLAALAWRRRAKR